MLLGEFVLVKVTSELLVIFEVTKLTFGETLAGITHLLFKIGKLQTYFGKMK
jgi:hypothetical protein